MTSKDASKTRSQNFKTLFSLVGGAAAVLAICLLARSFWGPSSATAQATKRSGARTQTVPAPPTRSNTKGRSNTASPQPATANIGDQPKPTEAAAVVNGQQITRQELANECMRRYGEEVLESIINKHLIWQACQKHGIKITQHNVEAEIKEMAAKFGLPTDRWLTMLERERDISPDHYRREIIWPTLALRHLAAKQIIVTQDEIQKAFETQYGPKVKARMIAVSSEKKARDVLQRAKAAPDKFGELAKQFSEDANTAAAHGIIPPIRKHIGHDKVEQVAFSLKPGQISEIIPVANQFLILSCEKQLKKTIVAGTRLEQIQQQLRDQIRDDKLRTAAGDLFKNLQAESQVVNVFNDARLRQQMPGVAATINGRQIPIKQLASECLLRHGKEVLLGEINRVVLLQELRRRNKTVADAAIDAEIARAAESYGYRKPDQSPDVEAWLKTVTETDEVTVELYVRDAVWPSVALKQLVNGKIEVTQDDLQKGFESNYGQRVEVLAIVLGNQRQANEIWDMARNRATDEFFGELAHQNSIEPVSRANFGKVPPIRMHGGQPVLEEEAFNLVPGKGAASMSGILNVGDKFVILRCLGRTVPKVQDFNAVKHELYKDIHEKKLRIAMADEFDRLKEVAQIDNFLAGTSQPGRKMGPPRSSNRSAAPAGFQAPTRTKKR
jgi:hypothetical protein